MKAQSKTMRMAIGVVLIISVFIGIALNGCGQTVSNVAPENLEEGATLASINTENTEIVVTETIVNEIIVNEFTSEVSGTGFFGLSPDNYYEYTKEELFDYYGIEFDISNIFPDMIEENTNSYGIFKYSDGSDMKGHNFTWVNPTDNEKVSIEIIKGGTPKTDINLAAGDISPLASTISGENVNIFRFESDGQSGYYAEFGHKNLGFSVYGYNFDEEDFVSILSYLISC